MSKIDTISPLFGLALPEKPGDTYPYDSGAINEYILSDDDVTVLVPARSELDIRKIDANKTLSYAINLALNIPDEDSMLGTIETAHGLDEVGRFRHHSIVKSHDMLALHNNLVLSPSRHNKIAGVFGVSAVLLCRISEKQHDVLVDDLRKIPSHKNFHPVTYGV